jgi:hypothetical protein
MQTFKVSASRTVYFEIEIDAVSEQDAISKVKNIDDTMDMGDYWAGEEALQIDAVTHIEG